MKLFILLFLAGCHACPQGLTPCEEKALTKTYVETSPLYVRTGTSSQSGHSSGAIRRRQTHVQGGLSCVLNEDCPTSMSCLHQACVNPCTGGCGRNAKCQVRRHIPVCTCPPGTQGDASKYCEEEQRTCPPGYSGDPRKKCFKVDCTSNSQCPSDELCDNYICRSPCPGVCGDNAVCKVRNHNVVCSCPKDYLGDPFVRCFTECSRHSDCGPYRACNGIKCFDPCEGVCGIGANCEVKNYKAICSCPKGYKGHPFERCEPFTPEDLCIPNPCGTGARCQPGKDRQNNDRPVCTCPPGYRGDPLTHCQRGDCIDHSQCPSTKACYNALCENPCSTNPCGIGAVCEPKNHSAICRCPKGYDGDPLDRCDLARKTTTVRRGGVSGIKYSK